MGVSGEVQKRGRIQRGLIGRRDKSELARDERSERRRAAERGRAAQSSGTVASNGGDANDAMTVERRRTGRASRCSAANPEVPVDVVIVRTVPRSSLSLIEFPADAPARARRFWMQLLGVELEVRQDAEGEGWQTHSASPAVGVHARGRGPGDSFCLPYFAVSDVAEALKRVEALGGSVVHPGEKWAICKDSEGSPLGLAQESPGG
jgi:predicted enzyme related to lactoylglutathione lyase